MIGAFRSEAERRVLVVAPTGRDAPLIHRILDGAGIACASCPDLDRACTELAVGAAALLVTEEVVAQEGHRLLESWLAAQPTWSDLPVLMLTRTGADSTTVAQAMDLLGNVTVLERPTRVAALVSAVRSALRSRLRQYDARQHLADRERAAVALQVADRRKDEFLAMLAHELRNPLAPIRNTLYALRRMDATTPSVARACDVMDRQVNHLVRLVDDLMEVSRITRGEIELKRELVTIADVVGMAVETSRPLIDAARHHLAVELPADPLTVEGDPIRLAQVLSNLLNNAAKYTDPGGHIRVAADRDADHVAVSVRDDGVGIPPELHRSVFEMFTQVDRSTTRSQGGLGIGLSLVKRLVDLHGGSVDVHSEGIGRGTELVVRLPLARSVPRAGEAERATDARPLGGRRVLVVDDNRDAATSLGMLLEHLGAEVRVVFSGVDALAAVGQLRPTVVLLDIGMPDMDGLQVAQHVRSRPELGRVTLVALTGWGKDDDRARSRTAGFDHHLTKPADIGQLTALLRAAGN